MSDSFNLTTFISSAAVGIFSAFCVSLWNRNNQKQQEWRQLKAQKLEELLILLGDLMNLVESTDLQMVYEFSNLQNPQKEQLSRERLRDLRDKCYDGRTLIKQYICKILIIINTYLSEKNRDKAIELHKFAIKIYNLSSQKIEAGNTKSIEKFKCDSNQMISEFRCRLSDLIENLGEEIEDIYS